MARSIVEATQIVLDVSSSVAEKDKDELQSFFASSRVCVMKIVERKIFSRPSDLIGIILAGSDETNNNLSNGTDYRNISVATNLGTPTWSLVKTVRDKIKTSDNKCDWVDALHVAVDSMERQLDGAKVACKKIVLFSDLKTRPNCKELHVQSLIDSFKSKNIELIVIGPEIWMENETEPSELLATKSKERIDGELTLKRIISELDAIACTFEEAIFELMFHKKRTVNAHPWNADLRIGPDIAFPVSAFIKIKSDQSIGSWKRAYKPQTTKHTEVASEEPTGEQTSSGMSAIVKTKSYYQKDDTTAAVDELDVIYGYAYGGTIVPFTKFDKAMEYESGPKCLDIYGFTKEQNIDWGNLIGNGTYFVLPRKGDLNAKIALEALVTALVNLRLVGVARKVYNKNNAPHMNVLFPIVEETFKCFSMIELAYKEDYKHMFFPSLDQKKYKYSDEQTKAIDNLIDSMNLSDLDAHERELFSIDKMINPALQHTFDTIAYRALYPDRPLPLPRPEVQELLEVPPAVAKMAEEPLEMVRKHFQLIVKEQTKGGKSWINEQLKKENDIGIEDNAPKRISNNENPISALAVVTSKITSIGTINPSKDFLELLSYDVPFDELFDQMKNVIEQLILNSVGSSYLKPLSAFKTFREACVSRGPVIFNSWLVQLKAILFERFKSDFFQVLVDYNLGLITKSENEMSTKSDDDAQTFLTIPAAKTNNDPQEMDTTDIDDLFS